MVGVAVPSWPTGAHIATTRCTLAAPARIASTNKQLAMPVQLAGRVWALHQGTVLILPD